MAEITQERVGKELFEAHYEALIERLDGAQPVWLRELREAGIERFRALDLPTTRQEQWRFTNIETIKTIPFQSGAPAAEAGPVTQGIERYGIGAMDAVRVVFVNGRFAPEHSDLHLLPDGAIVGSLAEQAAADDARLEPYLGRIANWQSMPFAALNTALFEDGLFVSIPAGMTVAQPIHLMYLQTGGDAPPAVHPRNLILMGEGSELTLIESYAGLDDSVYLVNAVTEVEMGERAIFDHYKLQQESRNAFHFQTLEVHQRGGGSFDTHALTLGGKLGRNDIGATIDGEHAETILNGLYLLTGSQLFDTHTLLDHAKPHCHSREMYKGILNGGARAIFRGKILVRQHAQKTDAVQSSKNLLLSGSAQVNAQPQLEIYADDVKCTHGATIGQLNADALFYLQTRGLDAQAARSMLVFAFARDNLTEVRNLALREYLETLIHQWLEEHGLPEEA